MKMLNNTPFDSGKSNYIPQDEMKGCGLELDFEL